MKIAIPKEASVGETRVAATPETVRQYVRAGLAVAIETGAGAAALATDEAYRDAGAEICGDAAATLGEVDVVLKVRSLIDHPTAGRHEVDMLTRGALLISLLQPLGDLPLVRRLSEAGISAIALDMIPRISRAQSMDVLSSQNTVAGYKAVLLAANETTKMVPMMMTAAGTIRPASVLVIGAGVAGLQAIATARRLGAVVKAIDTRPAVAEQIKSLGAKFIVLEVDHPAEGQDGYAADLGEEFYKGEQEIIAPHAVQADIIITTALIPGRSAPLLIPESTVRSMKAGAVIVDLAAAAGGNCTLSEPDRRIEAHGTIILAPTNLPAQLPVHASQMFARNVAALLDELAPGGQLNLDTENEIIRSMLITHGGQVVHPQVAQALDRSETEES